MLRNITWLAIHLIWPLASHAKNLPWQRNQVDLRKNFNNMNNLCVFETGGEYHFIMWFFGWAATATNKENWDAAVDHTQGNPITLNPHMPARMNLKAALACQEMNTTMRRGHYVHD